MKSHPFKASSYDAIVIGARCGGAATAMLLARAGLRVLAIDRQVYGSDTLSTHALMRPAVVQLARWGVLERIVAKSTPVITSTSFHYGANDIVSVPIQADAAIPGLVAPRRTVLDRTLVDAALEAGAEVVHEVIAQELLRDRSDRVVGVKVGCADGDLRSLNASIVVGADGLGSIVARQVGARTIYSGQSSAATIYTYTENPGLNGFHWYFGERSAAGIIPTNDDKVCVFVATPDERIDRATNLGLADRHIWILRGLVPSMAEHIAASGCSTPRGFRGAAAILRQAYGPGWLLVGDSGLFRDPITAHGISDALRDAEGAARAILAGSYRDFSLYQEQRDTLARPVMQATEGICGFDWNVSQLKELHQQLSAAMKNEVRALVDGPLPPFAPKEPSANHADAQQNVVSPMMEDLT